MPCNPPSSPTSKAPPAASPSSRTCCSRMRAARCPASCARTATSPRCGAGWTRWRSRTAACARTTMIVETLQGWIDEDRKHTALKALQGMVWEAGYRSGDFTAPRLSRCRRRRCAAGTRPATRCACIRPVRSPAQRLLFGHTDAGDLLPLFAGFFDTEVGRKREADSYRAHRRGRWASAPADILFLSDVVEELDAAREAGMRTVLVDRREDYPQPRTGEAAHGHARVEQLRRHRLPARHEARRCSTVSPSPAGCWRRVFARLAAAGLRRRQERRRARSRRCWRADIAALAPQRPGQVDLYVVGFAGDSTENVFRNEVAYLDTLMSRRFGAQRPRRHPGQPHRQPDHDAAAAGDPRQPAHRAGWRRQGDGPRRGRAAAVPDHARHRGTRTRGAAAAGAGGMDHAGRPARGARRCRHPQPRRGDLGLLFRRLRAGAARATTRWWSRPRAPTAPRSVAAASRTRPGSVAPGWSTDSTSAPVSSPPTTPPRTKSRSGNTRTTKRRRCRSSTPAPASPARWRPLVPGRVPYPYATDDRWRRTRCP